MYLLQANKCFNLHKVYLLYPDYEKNGCWLDYEHRYRSQNILSNRSSVNLKTRVFYSELALQSMKQICDITMYCAPHLLNKVGKVDVSRDGVHPGPQTHKLIAEWIKDR